MTSTQATAAPPMPAGGAHADRFRIAFQASPVPMGIARLDGALLDANEAFERRVGDMGVPRVFLADLVEGALPELPADGSTLVLPLAGDDGVDVHIAPLRDASGDVDALLLTVQPRPVRPDEEAQRQLQFFADTVAHDLRSPLRTIESFAKVLEHRAGPRLEPSDLDYLARISAAARRMGGLLAALGELANASRTELHATDVDLSLLAEWVATELQDASPTRQAVINVQPGLSARGDERMLRTLLQALLDNAWKFSGDRDVVHIDVTGAQHGDCMRLEIRDQGSGFDMRYAHKLFQPFQRLHAADQGAGHGLGLAIARRIAQRHGGRVSAQSQLDGGSTFTVELPAVAGAKGAVDA